MSCGGLVDHPVISLSPLTVFSLPLVIVVAAAAVGGGGCRAVNGCCGFWVLGFYIYSLFVCLLFFVVLLLHVCSMYCL